MLITHTRTSAIHPRMLPPAARRFTRRAHLLGKHKVGHGDAACQYLAELALAVLLDLLEVYAGQAVRDRGVRGRLASCIGGQSCL